jgi:hypothetical protein
VCNWPVIQASSCSVNSDQPNVRSSKPESRFSTWLQSHCDMAMCHVGAWCAHLKVWARFTLGTTDCLRGLDGIDWQAVGEAPVTLRGTGAHCSASVVFNCCANWHLEFCRSSFQLLKSSLSCCIWRKWPAKSILLIHKNFLQWHGDTRLHQHQVTPSLKLAHPVGEFSCFWTRVTFVGGTNFIHKCLYSSLYHTKTDVWGDSRNIQWVGHSGRNALASACCRPSNQLGL